MNETTVNKVRKLGDGQYHLTRSQAGEAYRAAKAYKIKNDVVTWRRPRKSKETK